MVGPIEQLKAAYESETCARETVNMIVQKTLLTVREREEEEDAIRHSTKRVAEDMMGIIEWYSIDCDRGETQSDAWLPDEEPTAPATDAWSRCSLPTRPAAPAKIDDDMLALPFGAQQPPITRREHAQSDMSSFVTDASQLGKLQDLDAVPPPNQPLRRRAVKAEVQMDRWTRAAQQRAKKAAMEAAEIERVLQIRKESRGKTYTYDHGGRVLIVQPPDGEKLPPSRTSPAIALYEDSPQQHSLEPTRKSPLRQADGKRAGVHVKVGGATASKAIEHVGSGDQVPPFRPSEFEQPPLISSLSLGPGVTLREGGQVKQQSRSRDADHLSLAEYAALGTQPARQPAADREGAGSAADREGAGSGLPKVVQPGSPEKLAPPIFSEPKVAPLVLVNRSAVSARGGSSVRGGSSQSGAKPLADEARGQRGRLPRERPLHANMPLDGQQVILGTPSPAIGTESLPLILTSPSQGSVHLSNSQALPGTRQGLKMSRGTFERRQRADVVNVRDPQLLDTLFSSDSKLPKAKKVSMRLPHVDEP